MIVCSMQAKPVQRVRASEAHRIGSVKFAPLSAKLMLKERSDESSLVMQMHHIDAPAFAIGLPPAGCTVPLFHFRKSHDRKRCNMVMASESVIAQVPTHGRMDDIRVDIPVAVNDKDVAIGDELVVFVEYKLKRPVVAELAGIQLESLKKARR